MSFWTAAVPAKASEPLKTLCQVVVQDQGQIKPLRLFAFDALTLIAGTAQAAGGDPLDSLLVMLANAEHWKTVPLVQVSSVSLRRQLGLPQRATHASLNQLAENPKWTRLVGRVVKRNGWTALTVVEQDAVELYERFVAAQRLLDQEIRMVPPHTHTASAEWLSIRSPDGYPWEQQAALKRVWASVLKAKRERDAEGVAEAGDCLARMLQHLNPALHEPLLRRFTWLANSRLWLSPQWDGKKAQAIALRQP